MKNSIRNYLTDAGVLTVLVAGFMLLYGSTMARYPVNYADSDDLLLAAWGGGLAHPPGYPLLVLPLGWFLRVSGVDPVLVANGWGVVIEATAVGMFYLMLRELAHLVGLRQWAREGSVLGTIMWGKSWYVWAHGTVLEVFGLELLLLLALTWMGLRAISRLIRVRELVVMMVLLALVGFHHVLGLVLGIPVYLGVVYLKRKTWSGRKIGLSLLGPVVIFLALFGLYAGFEQQRPYGWKVEPSWQGWWAFYARKLFADGGSQIETDAFGLNPQQYLNSLVFLVKYLILEMTVLGLGISLVGWWYLHRRMKFLFGVGLLAAVLSGPILTFYLKFPLIEETLDTAYFWGISLRLRMYYVLLLVSFVMLGLGLIYMGNRLIQRRWVKGNWLWWGVLGIVTINLWNRYPQMQVGEDNFTYEFSRHIITGLPKEAILVVDTDMAFAFLTQQQIYAVRPDVAIIPQRFSVTPTTMSHIDQTFGGVDFGNDHYWADVISAWVNRGREVFLYSPTPLLLSELGVEGNPYYLLPHGYVVKIVKNQEVPDSEADLGLSKQLVSQQLDAFDWWLKGLRGHVGILQITLGYYNYRLGFTSLGDEEMKWADELLTLPKAKQLVESTANAGQSRFKQEQTYLQYKPLDVEAYIDLGDKAYDEEYWESAVYYFGRAVRIEETNLEARKKLSLALIKMGMVDEAARQRAVISAQKG